MSRWFVAAVPEGLDANQDFKILHGKLKRTSRELDFDVKWVPRELWHVTLVFLGELAEDVQPVVHAIDTWSSSASNLSLRLHGLGAFPEEESARVLWVGVQMSQEFLDLQADLKRRLEPWIATKDTELEFRPHLTLARFRNPLSAHRLIHLGGRKFFGDYKVDEVILFESVLQGNVPKYIPRFRKRLKSISDQ